MSLRLISAPDGYPVTLDQAKAQCRVDHTDDDDLFSNVIIPAATAKIENGYQRRYLTQTVEWVFQEFPFFGRWGRGIKLPLASVGQVVSIKYTDASGTVQTLDPSLYIVTPRGAATMIYPRLGTIWPIAWPSEKPVAIQFTVGGAVADVPPNVIAAILLVCGHLYQNREAVSDGRYNQPFVFPMGVDDLMLAEAWD